jgi:GPH family glycoside/pentoside/hexuronide:cation symporter
MTVQATPTAVAVRPFGFRDKFGYAFGDFGNNTLIALVNFLFLKFYTDVMGVDAALVGIVLTVVAIGTIFANIVIGQLVDRSKTTKNGKFRPWILRVSGPFAVMSFLLYANWLSGAALGVKIGWMIGSYILWLSVFYGSIEIPYGALPSVMTNNPNDRIKLSNYRNLGGSFAIAIVSIVIPLLVYSNVKGNSVLSGTKLMWCALAVSVIAFGSYMITYFLTTERVRSSESTSTRIDIKAVAKAILVNRALLAIVFVVMIRELSNTSLQGMASYIYPNYFNDPAAQSLADLLSTVLALLVFFFMGRIGIRFGKKETVAAGCLLIAASELTAFILHTHSPYVWIAFYLTNTLGIGAFGALSWAFITDIIDDTQVRTNRRAEGAVTSVYTMATQIGQALSSLVLGFMLSFIGYTQANAFKTSTVNGLYDIATLVPMSGFILTALILIIFYPLNKERVNDNAVFLAEHHPEQNLEDDVLIGQDGSEFGTGIAPTDERIPRADT